MWWMGLVACSADLHLAAVEPVADDAVVAVFPPDGARRLSGVVPVRVVLGAEASGERPTVWARGEGLACVVGVGGTWVDCGNVPGGDLTVRVRAGGTVVTATGLADLPREDVAWDLLADATVSLGGRAELPLDGHLVVVHEAGTLVGGPAREGEGEGLEIMAPGMTLVLPATELGGAFHAASTATWLVLRVSDGAMPLLVLDVSLEIDADGAFVLEAALPALSVLQLTEATDAPFDAPLDLDRDGDGRGDATSLRLEGVAAPVTLAGWSPKG
ncbi:MAG: hypothetical protein ACOZNI_32010 [Myxococcota bacterium]